MGDPLAATYKQRIADGLSHAEAAADAWWLPSQNELAAALDALDHLDAAPSDEKDTIRRVLEGLTDWLPREESSE